MRKHMTVNNNFNPIFQLYWEEFIEEECLSDEKGDSQSLKRRMETEEENTDSIKKRAKKDIEPFPILQLPNELICKIMGFVSLNTQYLFVKYRLCNFTYDH